MVANSMNPPDQAVQGSFPGRRKLLSDRNELISVSKQIENLIRQDHPAELRRVLAQFYPPDMADIITFLKPGQADIVFKALDIDEQAEVLDEVDDPTKARFLKSLEPVQVARILERLHSDEDTDILQAVPPERREVILAEINPEKARRIRALLAYPCDSAGGIMSTAFVAVPETSSFLDALDIYRKQGQAEPLDFIYVLDPQERLAGTITVHALVTGDPKEQVKDNMETDLVSIPPETDQERVARIFARYDLTALPVVEPASGRLLGIITADDIIDVIQEENTEDFMRMAGSDAEEMEKRSPVRLALLRLPWIMATMFIEMVAGFVIHFFNGTLARVLLLASFMPIISAISGNTGLQSATIIVRGLSTGKVQVTAWRRAILRQLTMTVILGAATGLTLGIIGAIWYGKAVFGIVVATGMFMAVNIAGVVGTVVPMTSKSLGFDPAITSGPFETAFQDVVGISIFLGLATVMLHYLIK